MKQISKLEKLANKITELNEKFGELYYNRVSPISIQQLNSWYLKHKIGGNDNIEQLLVDSPIFEMTDNIQSFDFIKTTVGDSQQFILERNNQFSYKLKQVKSLHGQIATKEKLYPNITYIFRCKINKKLFEEKCCFLTSNKGYGLDRILKGKYLTEVAGDIDYIEVRENISKRVVLFMDYPKYEHINQVSEQKILQNIDYSFGIRLYPSIGDDYVIDIESRLYDDTYDLLNFEVNELK